MRFVFVFNVVSYVYRLISHLILALILNNSPFNGAKDKDMDTDNGKDKSLYNKCVKSGDNNINVNNDGSSGDSKDPKFTEFDDKEDKENDKNNNYSKASNPVITNYYCYDQRVYNIYKMTETEHKSKGLGVLEAVRILNWKYILILLSLIIGVTVFLCYLGADMLSWLIFHKVFGYLFNNHFVVVRSDVPV